MIRTFATHKIRRQTELSSCLWNFQTLPEDGPGIARKLPVPSCWETFPDLMTYRGKAVYQRTFAGGGNLRIECKGVSHTAQVFLDDEKITEIGAGAIYGYRTPSHVKWSEEYQAQTLDDQLRAVLAHAGCSGVYIWQFCDVPVSEEWFASRPRTMNNKGIVDEYRRPKLSYDTVKAIFREEEFEEREKEWVTSI